MSKKNGQKTSVLYGRLFAYIKPFWPVLLLGILANACTSGIDAGFTYLMKPFLDKGFINVDMPFVRKIPLFILLGVTARGCICALGNYCMTWVARSVVQVLRKRVFMHIVHLPASIYDEATSGQLLSKLLYDVEQVAQVSADALTDFVQNVCLVIGLLTVMFVVSWQLSIFFLITIPFIGAVVSYTSKRIRRMSHRVQKAMGIVTEIASETIDGYREIRVFGGEKYEIAKFNQAIEISRINDLKVASSKALNVSLVQIILAIGIAAIVFSAIKLATVVTVTAGVFLAIIASMLQLIKPMKTLTTLNATVQRGLAGAESVFDLLDKQLEPTTGIHLKERVKGDIAFQNVYFSYSQSQPVLRHINLNIRSGETVAIVGHSGSGKTTIARLLPRFYEIDSGQITLDGTPIDQVSLSSLRTQMAMVSQNVTLFNDTIAKNIAFAMEGASIEAIISAAKLAYADEFIQKLPDAYETKIGENGLLLSGGQRQRIAIARAILKDAPILILDEATSALDSESEYYIQLALDQVMKNRTTLVIAHRLSTIKRADKIIVLHHGEIVEQGNHQELLEKGGAYTKLYQSQHLGSELEPA